MKKMLLALTLLLPWQAKANSVNLDLSYTAQPIGVASQNASILYGVQFSPNSYTANVARQVAVDANGNLLTSAGPGGVTYNAQTMFDPTAFGYLTTTAAGTAARGGSMTAIVLTSTYAQNLTVMAGVNAPGMVTIYPGNGVNAAFFWALEPGNWTVAPNTPISVSTTPVMMKYGIGDWLNLSVTGQALTVTPLVRASAAN